MEVIKDFVLSPFYICKIVISSQIKEVIETKSILLGIIYLAGWVTFPLLLINTCLYIIYSYINYYFN